MEVALVIEEPIGDVAFDELSQANFDKSVLKYKFESKFLFVIVR